MVVDQSTVKQPATEAWLRADAKRTERHLGLEKIVADDYSACAFLGMNKINKPYAVLYRGRSLKVSSAFYYEDIEKRETAIKQFFAQYKKTPKVDTNKHYTVGDVLYSSWGYDQTNINFYKVLRLIGSTMIEVVEIASVKEFSGIDGGTCLPDVNKVIGEPIRKSVSNSGYISINSFAIANLLAKHEDGLYTACDWSSGR